ncbi:MAG: hypothetical protein ABJA71_09170 [Ginsengibacter sp.]
MLHEISEKHADALNAPKYLPCISLIMPFNPKMGQKKELGHKLKTATRKIENELLKDYPADKAMPVLKKLGQLIKELDYNTHKTSIAIFISPLIEKVYYLDMPVEEKIFVDESFEIRDLICCKKQIHKYLLVVLSGKWIKVHLGDDEQFIPILSNVAENVAGCKKDIPEKVGNLSELNKTKEIKLDIFLRHTDNGLHLLLMAYKLPLFVMGTPKKIEHFKRITHNESHVAEYIPGNFEEMTESELHKIMETYVADWEKVVQHDLLNQVDEARSQKKLAIGIKEVCKATSQKRVKLLVVEKNFIFPAQESSTSQAISGHDDSANNAFYIKDVVNDVIEKVLTRGGEVDFVEEGLLKKYHRIVLIEH